jgi:hypothetical protein
MVDTTALVGTAKVGTARVGSLGDTPPSRLRVHGACWELVADQAAIDAAKDHVAEREQVVRDDLALVAQEKADAAKDAAVQAAGEAAQRADEALEAALGELVEGKSNVFIQSTPPVESMQRQGVLWIDTTPVTLADGTTVPGHTPKTWDPATSAWVAVTDSVAVEAARAAAAAHEAAEAAADAAGAAMAEARYAPRIADRMPTPTDGAGKPDGAGWWQYDPTSQLLVQGWRWTGAVWERLDMDPVMIPVISIGTGTVGDLTGDRVTVTGEFVARVAQILQLDVAQLTVTEDAVINELVARAMAAATAEFQVAYIQNLRSNGAVMDEAVIGDLAANIITSGLFRTARDGQRLEIDSNGLVMYGIDADGNDFEMVRIGPSGENLITAGSTMISPSGVQAPAGSFDRLSVGGDELNDVLAQLPRGMRAWGQLTTTSQLDGDTSDYARRGEIQTTLEAGRLYRIRLSEHLVEVTGGTNTNVVEELRYSFDGTPILHGITPNEGTYRGVFARSPVFAGNATSVNGMEFMLDTGSWSAGRGFWLMWMIRPEVAGRPVRVLATGFYSPVLTIEDTGPSMPSTLKRWNDGDGGSGTTEPADPDPIVVRRTQTWDAASFGGDTRNGTVYQGTLSPYGNRYGGWVFFPAMRGALAGSTIEKFEVYLENAHWYYGSGGTAVLYPNDGTYKGIVGSGTTSANWPRYAGRWVTVPSSWHAQIANGTYKGVSVYTTNTGLTYYGQFKGSPTKFRVTYRR